MRAWYRRAPAGLLVAALLVLVAPISAEAAPPPSLLPDGASLGEVAGVVASTEPAAAGGPCPTETDPDGYAHASVFVTTATAYSLLRLSVADDLEDSLSLCRVRLHEADEGSDELPATPPLVETDECAGSSSCSISRWLSAGKTYAVVLWASPPDPSTPGPEEASFSYDASVKLPVNLTTAVDGERIKDGCSGYHEIVAATPYAIRSASTSVSSGTIQVILEKKSGSSWFPYATYSRTLAEGTASLWLKAGSSGTYRVTTLLPETPTRLGISKTVYVAHVTPKWQRYSDGGVRLKVPWYHQQMRLSCEAATLRMAHNYFKAGSIDSDWDVLRKTGVDRRKKKGNRWGNPNKTFVGNPKGKMMSTGYGVHWAPIASAATEFSPCRPAIVLKQPSRATISRYVAMGFPVIVWGAHSGAGGTYKKRWKAWDGRWITAWSVEHVWVVVGFHGKVGKPTSFIVHNPSGGARQRVSLKAFDNFTKYFRRAVVVRG